MRNLIEESFSIPYGFKANAADGKAAGRAAHERGCRQTNKFVRTKMRPKKEAKIQLQREICQIPSDLSDLQV